MLCKFCRLPLTFGEIKCYICGEKRSKDMLEDKDLEKLEKYSKTMLLLIILGWSLFFISPFIYRKYFSPPQDFTAIIRNTDQYDEIKTTTISGEVEDIKSDLLETILIIPISPQ